MPDAIREKFVIIVSGLVLLALALTEGVPPSSPQITSAAEPTGPGPGLVATARAEADLPNTGVVQLRVIGHEGVVEVAGGSAAGLGVPAGSYLVAATDGDRLAGLSLHLATSDDVVEAVRIDGRSTARALVGLLPGIMAESADLTAARIDAAESTQAFVELSTRLASEAVDLRDPPPELSALAATAADEVAVARQTITIRQPPCEEENQSLTLAPICVGVDEAGDLLIRNATPGWLVVSRGEGDQPCALVAPGTPIRSGDDPSRVDITLAGELMKVSLAQCGGEITLVTTGRRTALLASERLVNGLSVMSAHALPTGALLGVELSDPRTDSAGATEELAPFLARGGPVSELSQAPTAAGYAEASLAVLGTPVDPAAGPVMAHIRAASGQMQSIPADFTIEGLLIRDIAL